MKFTTDAELAKLNEIYSYLEQYHIILWEDHKMFGSKGYFWFDKTAEYGLGPYPTAFGALQGAEAYIKDTYEKKK